MDSNGSWFVKSTAREMEMKRYLIPILIITVLVSVFLLGCNGVSSAEPKASDYEQRLAKLEQQMQELSVENALPPKVIEKDWDSGASKYSDYSLPFNLKVGDRVEGEVSITPNQSAPVVVGEVRDPYGNRIVETWTVGSRGGFAPNHGFPWRFAFIAPTDGEYKIRVYVIGGISTGKPVAHLKIVVYTND